MGTFIGYFMDIIVIIGVIICAYQMCGGLKGVLLIGSLCLCFSIYQPFTAADSLKASPLEEESFADDSSDIITNDLTTDHSDNATVVATPTLPVRIIKSPPNGKDHISKKSNKSDDLLYRKVRKTNSRSLGFISYPTSNTRNHGILYNAQGTCPYRI